MKNNKIKDMFMKSFHWYHRKDVQFELVKQTYMRELALIVPTWIKDKNMRAMSIRNLKCHSVQHLQFLLKALEWNEKQTIYNFYYSLARYQNGIPNQTMNMNKRDNSDWNKNHYKEMRGYDFLIDIDGGDHSEIELAHYSMLKVTELFNDFKVPHYVKFSGKGFHVIIPHERMPKRDFDLNNKNNIYFYHSELAKILSQELSEMIDLKIYDPRRLCKLSYSLSIYENEIYVCYPLHMKYDIENFQLNDYKLENFNKNIQRRGMRLFNRQGTTAELLAMKNKLKKGDKNSNKTKHSRLF